MGRTACTETQCLYKGDMPNAKFGELTATSHINPLNADLNPICHLLALLGAHHILHVGRIRVKANIDRLAKNKDCQFLTKD
jgi:hypothetical protein